MAAYSKAAPKKAAGNGKAPKMGIESKAEEKREAKAEAKAGKKSKKAAPKKSRGKKAA